MAEALAKFFEDANGQRRGPRDKKPHFACDLRRIFEETDVNRGNTEEERRLKIDELSGCSAMIESLEQPHAAAAHQPAVQSVAEGVDVKQGEREEKAVVVRDLP